MKPIIFGLSGPALLDQEREFFLKQQPYGFIIFKRNIESKEQIQTLTKSLHDLFPERRVEIFIDQEGGRVARVKPPITSKEYPPAAYFGQMELAKGLVETQVNYKGLMLELHSLGITATCAPVADLLFDGADKVIGDRSFGSDPAIVASLCKAALKGIKDSGGSGVIKHIPGHGRASCDSHMQLPIVDTSLEELEKTDFRVFQLLSRDAKYAMTAHVVYKALDPLLPATLSKTIIDYIRHKIGFTGTLMTDDMSMKALDGDLSTLSSNALSAGCDLVLHCNGNMDEMKSVAKGVDDVTSIYTEVTS
jgi:beta-N-acetylhexosaminidase